MVGGIRSACRGASLKKVAMGTTIRSHSFTLKGQEYTVRAVLTGDGVEVRAFQGEKPANRFRYTVSWEKASQFAHYHGDAVRLLMQLAEDDLTAFRTR